MAFGCRWLALAQAMGLPTAKAQIFSVDDRHVLLVARYDRLEDADGRLVRIHQEDFCQALGVVPEMKYQNEGGPNLKACFDLIRNATRPSAPQVLRLLDAVVFNALIGNHDTHAKNFSLLYVNNTPALDALRTGRRAVPGANQKTGAAHGQRPSRCRTPGAGLPTVCRPAGRRQNHGADRASVGTDHPTSA